MISRPWSRDSSAQEFILSRSQSRSRDLKTQVSHLVSIPRRRFWQQHWIKVDVIMFLSHFLVSQNWGVIGTKLPCDISQKYKSWFNYSLTATWHVDNYRNDEPLTTSCQCPCKSSPCPCPGPCGSSPCPYSCKTRTCPCPGPCMSSPC